MHQRYGDFAKLLVAKLAASLHKKDAAPGRVVQLDALCGVAGDVCVLAGGKDDGLHGRHRQSVYRGMRETEAERKDRLTKRRTTLRLLTELLVA
eukprot:282270-Rhodomonas_salina.1